MAAGHGSAADAADVAGVPRLCRAGRAALAGLLGGGDALGAFVHAAVIVALWNEKRDVSGLTFWNRRIEKKMGKRRAC